MKHNIYDIIEVLSESTMDTIYNDHPEIFTEKLETNILDKTLAKTMTLYHGSNKDLETIKPTSINMGTRLSKMRVSSFWAKDKEYCILWAAMFVFYHMALPYRVSLKNKKIYTIDTNYAKKSDPKNFIHVSTWLKWGFEKEPLYLYTLKDVEIKKVGRGQINADEYTLDEEVKPTDKRRISVNEILGYVEYLPKEKFNTLPIELYGRRGKDVSFIEKIIFRDGKDTMTNRTKLYKKAISQYDAGIGNHKMISYKNGDSSGQQFVPDIKSIKK